ncbi:MAG: type I methionyl aminopeptidase [Myxococcota bacterium]
MRRSRGPSLRSNMPRTSLLTRRGLRRMRRAGAAAARTLDVACAAAAPGLTTLAIDDVVVRDTAARGGHCAQHGHRVPGAPPFPGHVCTSRNHVVCHGVPTSREVLEDGDILNIDVTTRLDGWHGDTSRTIHIGRPSPEGAHVVQVAERALAAGIAAVRPGAPLAAIGAAIEAVVHPQGCSIVREVCGHGIGRAMHQAPPVPHYEDEGSSFTLEVGLCFTIEPMVCLGRPEIEILEDGWTVVTRDRRWSAQAEHTLVVTEDGAEILTR